MPAGHPPRRWSILLWLTYLLLALAAVLALAGQAQGTTSAGDAGMAAGLLLLLLVAVPYRWARSQSTGRTEAFKRLGWTWGARAAILGAACGVLLFAIGPTPGASPGAGLVALGYGGAAAVSEELFFRGHLQRRIGSAQVLLFGVLHSSGGWSGIAFPLAAGAFLTLLARRGLAAAVAAHCIFNALAALP